MEGYCNESIIYVLGNNIFLFWCLLYLHKVIIYFYFKRKSFVDIDNPKVTIKMNNFQILYSFSAFGYFL